jgi:hypothetical protein
MSSVSDPVTRVRARGARVAKNLLRRLPSRPAKATPPPPAAPAVPDAPAAPADPRGPLVERLERGRALDEAVIDEVRALVGDGTPGRALALAESLRRDPATSALGRVAAGIVAHERGYVALAHAQLRDLPPDTWARLAPAEYVRSGLALAPDETLEAVRALVEADPPGVLCEGWYEILAAVFGYGAQELAREVFAVFDQHVGRDIPGWPEGPTHRDWMRAWVAADADSPTAPAPPDSRPVLAIMDYGHPGANRASANIGDHIQSIAGLAHVARHRGVRLHGEGKLVGLLKTLQDRTRPEFARDDLDADLEVMAVHRDASMYQPIPEGTWVLCFGWYMHALFTMRHGFPLHRNLRPIFISFHCNKRSLLTPDAVEYLRRYGPVGCRDWTTAHLLTSMGVPAFFSGCVTTTIGGVFPDAPAPPADAPVAYVDVPEDSLPADAVTYAHSSLAVRRRSFVANAKIALERLDTYRREHSRVVTSRLHCHLPLRSIGVESEFVPVNPADVRFAGLIDISDQQFEAIRSGLTEKLEQVLRLMIAGAPEAAVYAAWREATADDVAAAARELRRPVELQSPATKWAERLPGVVEATETHPPRVARAEPPVDCAVFLPRHTVRGAAALLDSLVEHASRPVRLWVLAPPDSPVDRLTDAFPEVTINSIALGPFGSRGRQLGLVLLPALIPEVSRLVVLPTPAVVTTDICELADLELGSHALAAPTRLGTASISGFGVIHTAANRLRDRPAAAAELRRAALARHGFDFDAFSLAPVVLDLARLRRDGFMDEGLRLARTFALKDVEILHFTVGPDRVQVPERWAAVPTRTPERGPGLQHWADAPKPWSDVLTPERELWQRHAVAS